MLLNESGLRQRMSAAHLARKIVIVGIIANGHDTGSPVMALTSRREMLDYVAMMGQSQSQTPGFIESICRDIRAAIANGTGRLSLNERADLVGNVVLLMAAKLATGDDRITDGSGLMTLAIITSSDVSLPWEKRGFLREEDTLSPVGTG